MSSSVSNNDGRDHSSTSATLNAPNASPHTENNPLPGRNSAALSIDNCNRLEGTNDIQTHAQYQSGLNTAVNTDISSGRSPSTDTYSKATELLSPNQWCESQDLDPQARRHISRASGTDVGRQLGTIRNIGSLSSASIPQQLSDQTLDGNANDSPSYSSTPQMNRSDKNLLPENIPQIRKRRQDRRELFPLIHGHHRRRNRHSSARSPLSPLASSSMIPGKSRSSSVRRSGTISAAAEEAAIEEALTEQNRKVICRTMNSYRIVNLLYQTDADLFDAIQEWKEAHPTLWVDDAIDAFASAKGADALAQLVYSTEAFDIILKYGASNEDLVQLFDNSSCASRSPLSSPKQSSPSQQRKREGIPTPLSGEGRTTELTATKAVAPIQPHSPTPSIIAPLDFVKDPDPTSHNGQNIRHSRLSELRRSPAKLLSKTLSLRLLTKSAGCSPHFEPDSEPTDSQRPQNISHIMSPMSKAVDGDKDTPLSLLPAPEDQPFQLLQPFNSPPDLSPSPKSSTIALESEDRLASSSSSSNMGNQPTARNSQYTLSASENLPSTGQQQSCLTTATEQQELTGDIALKIQRPRRISKAKLKEWKTQLHRSNFQLALLKEGLFIELEKSVNSDGIYVKVLAPFWRLEIEAQRTSYKADLASTLLPSIPYTSRILPIIKRLFPCLKQFGLEQRREAAFFKSARLTEFYLAEPERRWSDVVRHAGAIRKDGSHVGSHLGTDGLPGFFQTSRRGYLVNSAMMRTESRNYPYDQKMGLRSALRYGVYQKLYAIHDGSWKSHSNSKDDLNYRAQLRIKWVRQFWRGQPLDLVNAYFGERIGIYFAWLGHYTKWLSIPAVVGIAVFIFGIINAARSKKLDGTPNALFAIFDNVLTMPFAFFMSIWSTVYIEFWKRANQYYAFRWNMNDYERVELPRKEFRATRVRYSQVTGKRELYYPIHWKALRILVSSIAVLLAVLVVVGSVACLMIFKTWCRHHIGGQYVTVILTAMLNLVIIVILGEIWCRLAEWLTDKENHKYTDAYEASLIIKRYLFDFTNMYGTMFYYAFFKAPLGRKVFQHREDLQDTCQYDACITELTVQLAVVFIGKQILNGLFEMVFPKKILAEQALKRRKFLEARKRTRAPQWVKDDDLPSYEGRILKCFRKSVIQFGFCTLFVTSFPVAPAFALINNLIDIRLEALRLLTQYRRPIALRAKDIGMWEKIMEFVSFISVITNAAIIAFSSLWVKEHIFIAYFHANDYGELLAARLGFILVFEHIIFLFKLILRASIPSVPLTIKLAVKRSKYMARVANGDVNSDVDDDVIDLDFVSDSQSDEESDDGVSECSSTSALGEDGGTTRRPNKGLRWLWREKIPRKISPKSLQGAKRRLHLLTTRDGRHCQGDSEPEATGEQYY